LQVTEPEPLLLRLLAEVRILCESNAVRGALHAEVSELSRVLDGSQKVRAQGRLSAGELHAELTPGLYRDRIVQDLLDVLPLELVHEPDLVGVHEARVAHHVAAVGEVDREDRAAPVLDRRGAVLAELRLGRFEVAPGEEPLDAREERRVDAEDVLERAMLRTRLAHHDAAVFLQDLRADLARV